MKPRSTTSELPGMAVNVAAIKPPVQLSAVATFSPAPRHTCSSASACASSATPIIQPPGSFRLFLRRLDPSCINRLDEGSVVLIGLVGIGHRKLGERRVERIAIAQVPGDL